MNCGQLELKRLPTLLERSCDPRRSKAWSEAGELHKLYICACVTLTSLGEMRLRHSDVTQTIASNKQGFKSR